MPTDEKTAALFIGYLASAQIPNKSIAKRIKRGCIKVARDILIDATNKSNVNIDLEPLRNWRIIAAIAIKASEAVGSS
jgi:hypothetical protein